MTTHTLTQSDLNGFTGTEQWYRNPLYRWMTYTDGVQFFAEKAGAYWFLDIVGTELRELAKREGFVHVRLVALDGKARILADDGNGNALYARAISFTDCPDGDWRFYLEQGGPQDTFCLMLPSER